MIIAKYNVPTGSGSSSSVGTTAVAGGGSNVDITPLTEKVAALEAKVSQLEQQLSRVQSTLSGLDARFLSKLGDRSEYTYALGAVYTDHVQSEMYDNGVGYRVSGNPTAAVEDKYNFIIKDVGWGYVTWNTVLQSEATVVDTNTNEAEGQFTVTDVSIGATTTSGYMLLDCGATLTNERCFTVLSQNVEYRVRFRIGNQYFLTEYMDADTDSNGNYILFFQRADNVSFTIRFTWTYAFEKFGDMTMGSYRLYIKGTDAANNRTDCFAASIKAATLNASGVTVMNGDNGYRITSNGVQHTTDGGTTWT